MDTLKSLLEGFKGLQGSQGFYTSCYCTFASWALLGPGLFFIDAPHGRAAGVGLFGKSLMVNGNVGWFLMEIVSPITFFTTLLRPVLTSTPYTPSLSLSLSLPSLPSLATFTALPLPRKALATAFLLHYLNRSTISTLRNPGRAPMHISVPLAAVGFNFLNGYLMGSFVGGRTGGLHSDMTGWVFLDGLGERGVWVLFWVLMGGWAVGLVGNITHDEILYSLKKRKPKKYLPNPTKENPAPKMQTESRYSVPHGLMFDAPWGGISVPAYFCEWVEWACFAGACVVATRLAPPFPTQTPAAAWVGTKLVGSVWTAPPFVFLVNEVALMFPRAVNTHKWYKETFGEGCQRDGRRFCLG